MSSLVSSAVLAPTVARPAAPQPAATATRSLSGAGTTEVLNAAAAGKLLAIILHVDAAPTDALSCKVRVNIDGSGFEDVLLIYNAAGTFDAAAQALADVGNGDAIGDRIVLPMGVDFAASCVVSLETTSAGSAGTLRGVALHALTV